MAISPFNPPNQITEATAAIPSYIVANGAAVSSANPLPTTTGGAATFPITTLYQVTVAFTDTNGSCAVGNILQNIVVYSDSGSTVLNIWINTTAGFTLAASAPTANITPYIAGGGATAANQTSQINLATTGNTTLSAISGKLPATLGAKVTASSLAVNIASDQVVPVSFSSTAVTAAVSSVSNAGSTAANAIQVSFANTGTTAAIVAGTSLPANASVSFNAPSGRTINAITYDATGTTLLIAVLA